MIRPLLQVWETKGHDRNLTEALAILYESANANELTEDVLERLEAALPGRRE